MLKAICLFLLICAIPSWAYEIPKGMVGIGDLERAQESAKEDGKPVILVVAIKTQPET